MDFYAGYTGLDMKAEFDSFLGGGYFEQASGQTVLLRRLQNTPCACFDTSTGSPDPGCPYCQGEGYQWYETQEVAYIARLYGSVLGATTTSYSQNNIDRVGVVDDQRAIAYFSTETWPDYETKMIPTQKLYDKLYEVKLDPQGRIIYSQGKPIRVCKWRVQGVTLHHADGGKPTYFECGLLREAL